MEKRRQLLCWAGSIAVFLLVAAVFIGVPAAKMEPVAAPAQANGPVDRIVIDVLADYGDLELPEVSFFHGRHTKAVADAGEDCTACHKKKDGVLELSFQRLDDEAGTGLKDLYHDGCIGCHEDFAAKGLKTGPGKAECRSCHQGDGPEPQRLDAGFDKVLHFRHWDSELIAYKGEKDNCGACHHQYDAAAKKLVYAKGEESTCRSCHGEETVTDAELGIEVRSMPQAAHDDCVTCHYQLKSAGKDAYGPVLCADCHSAEGQERIRANDAKALQKAGGELPNLPMERPKAALMLPPLPEDMTPDATPAVMAPVAFDHKLHEDAADTCRVCHHKETKACSECHTKEGAAEGDFVTLDVAMHHLASEKSCVGCHRKQQQAKDCAGCHAQMDQAARPSEESCASCHQPLPDAVDMPLAARLDDEQQQNLAAQMLDEREPAGAYDVKDIPETVKIGVLSKEYEPSELPHRKIVLTLMESMKDNELAGTFHTREGTMCQGCHHNSPASKNPPSCASCHAKPFDPATPDRPGLKAAYHGQCMSCHKAMGMTELEKDGRKVSATNCVVCHDEKQ